MTSHSPSPTDQLISLFFPVFAFYQRGGKEEGQGTNLRFTCVKLFLTWIVLSSHNLTYLVTLIILIPSNRVSTKLYFSFYKFSILSTFLLQLGAYWGHFLLSLSCFFIINLFVHKCRLNLLGLTFWSFLLFFLNVCEF